MRRVHLLPEDASALRDEVSAVVGEKCTTEQQDESSPTDRSLSLQFERILTAKEMIFVYAQIVRSFTQKFVNEIAL